MESQARVFLEDYELRMRDVCFQSVVANWNYATNITDETEKIKLEKSLASASFTKESWKNLTSQFGSWREFKDPVLLRMFKKLTVLGSAALPDDKLKEVILPNRIVFP